ncbi:hypothetical protein GVN18_09390 [Pseudomonas sp. ODNR1LW]|jgi:hypothetical protein|uniref:hypothetical protein n=1 Tax=Pseudomonas putida TaxID=303 RepID=UPI0009809AD0|nr:hypothetical protein [Pseudomonas putida]NBB59489.1 hypothetical protein [Pseudomonas sp. ODNR1LW]OMQ30097.1 hypothetical protein BKX96_28920 [Pseudomonas putida]
MERSVPDPPSETPTNEAVTEDLLRDRSALYRAIDFYLTGDQLKGADRAMVFSVWHLLAIAKAMIDRSIECLGMKKG